MRVFYLVFLILLVASCNVNKIQEIRKEPKIDIIIPKNEEIIKNNKLVVKLNISNFKLVTPDKEPMQGQGHVQVWVDNMEFRSSNTEFVFENESSGLHTIKAELMLSNNTVLPYSKTIKVVVNKT